MSLKPQIRSFKPLFDDIPLPSKFKTITKRKPVQTETKPLLISPPAPISIIAIPELKVGGELEPEIPKRQNHDGYTVESLDSTDYK